MCMKFYQILNKNVLCKFEGYFISKEFIQNLSLTNTKNCVGSEWGSYIIMEHMLGYLFYKKAMQIAQKHNID